MEIRSKATDEGRIMALQVGFAALVDLLSRENPQIGYKVAKYLEDTGMRPANINSSASFYELSEIVRTMEALHGQSHRDDKK
ncbi:hypothetical protein IM977_004539 [Salmonella enterica subsp. enterica serovar Typhimurium]|nr:hypothetical protein [Salmonella enterica subsp. enterica serovar Typhimurium]